MKCDELKAETIVPHGSAITLQMYAKAEVDKAIAELKDKLRHYQMMAAIIKADKEELEQLRNATRWRKCSEELPSEDMEGEDFIVSNGFYSVICEWRGYWNNEPFMGDKNCDTVKYWTFAPKAPEAK